MLNQILTDILSMKVFSKVAMILRCCCYQIAVFHAGYIFNSHYLLSSSSPCCLVFFFLPPLLTSIDMSFIYIKYE